MCEVIKLIRVNDTVVNEKTGLTVGIINNGSVTFVTNVEGKIQYDEKLSLYLNEQKN